MHIEFNVVYYAKAALKERDMLKPTGFQRSVEAFIDEVDGDDAPLAARWPGVDIRYYEGRTFRRVFEPEKRLYPGSFSLSHHGRSFDFPFVHQLPSFDDILSRLKSGTDIKSLHGRYFELSPQRKSSFPPSRYHRYEYTESDEKRDRAKIERWSRSVLIIDGDFWVACPHPIYQVSKPGAVYPTTRRHTRWAGDKTDRQANAPYDECANACVFDSTQLPEATRLSQSLFGQAEVVEMEVFIPQALPPLDAFERINAVRLALELTCYQLVRAHGIGPSPAVLRAWADVIEIGDNRDVDELGCAVSRLLDHLPESAFKNRQDVVTIAKHTLDMIESREITLELSGLQ
jgi:hypothetical protein